jgi:hypothetical protein
MSKIHLTIKTSWLTLGVTLLPFPDSLENTDGIAEEGMRESQLK